METRGIYFDGIDSARREVTLRLEADRLLLQGGNLDRSWPVSEVRLSSPVGSLGRSIYLPDGGKCDLEDRVFARQLERLRGSGGFFRGVHRWESSLKLAFLALVLAVTVVWGFVQFGIPSLSEQAAYAVPPATEKSLGEETLQILDRVLFEPSQLAAERREELERLFSGVVAGLDGTERPYRLELRGSGGVGANAFALPGGIVILTDELVALAERDEEIAAVLAHEVGHVRHRHAMRQVIQGSAVGLLIATLSGDVFSASSMAAALPTMLVDAKFSRDMEREADDVALEYLSLNGQPVDHFAAILSRLEQSHAARGAAGNGGSEIRDYFSTHPATAERIERLEETDVSGKR